MTPDSSTGVAPAVPIHLSPLAIRYVAERIGDLIRQAAATLTEAPTDPADRPPEQVPTETEMEEEPAPRVRLSTIALLSVAEDTRFELVRV